MKNFTEWLLSEGRIQDTADHIGAGIKSIIKAYPDYTTMSNMSKIVVNKWDAIRRHIDSSAEQDGESRIHHIFNKLIIKNIPTEFITEFISKLEADKEQGKFGANVEWPLVNLLTHLKNAQRLASSEIQPVKRPNIYAGDDSVYAKPDQYQPWRSKQSKGVKAFNW